MRRRTGKKDPTIRQLEAEIVRLRVRRRVLRALLHLLSLVAIVSIIVVSAMWTSVLRITGESMAPTLRSGDIVLAWRGADVECGDIAVFSMDDGGLLLKRVIAKGGDTLEMRSDGMLLRNGELLQEEYISRHEAGFCDISFPFMVPQGGYFVMGDNRGQSLDSRSVDFGCVDADSIDSRTLVRLWPLNRLERF